MWFLQVLLKTLFLILLLRSVSEVIHNFVLWYPDYNFSIFSYEYCSLLLPIYFTCFSFWETMETIYSYRAHGRFDSHKEITVKNSDVHFFTRTKLEKQNLVLTWSVIVKYCILLKTCSSIWRLVIFLLSPGKSLTKTSKKWPRASKKYSNVTQRTSLNSIFFSSPEAAMKFKCLL